MNETIRNQLSRDRLADACDALSRIMRHDHSADWPTVARRPEYIDGIVIHDRRKK